MEIPSSLLHSHGLCPQYMHTSKPTTKDPQIVTHNIFASLVGL